MVNLFTGIGLIILGWLEIMGVCLLVGLIIFFVVIILGLLLKFWDWIRGRRR